MVPEVAVPLVAVVEERVVLSKVWEEVLEPGGEREDWSRERDGVVYERGRVDDGRRGCCPVAKVDVAPRVCAMKRSLFNARCFPFAGISSSAVGGTPR